MALHRRGVSKVFFFLNSSSGLGATARTRMARSCSHVLNVFLCCLGRMCRTTWAAWKAKYPKSKVLRGPKPVRAYAAAYAEYHAGDRIIFPLSRTSDRLRNKAVVSGLSIGGADAAWSHDRLASQAAERPEKERATPLVWHEDVGGTNITVAFDPVGSSVTVTRATDEGAEPIPVLRAYWFAWFTFHPETTLDGT